MKMASIEETSQEGVSEKNEKMNIPSIYNILIASSIVNK